MWSENGRRVRWLAIFGCVAGLLGISVGGFAVTGMIDREAVAEDKPLELKTRREIRAWARERGRQQNLELSARERNALYQYFNAFGSEIAAYIRGLSSLPERWKPDQAKRYFGFSSVEEFIELTDSAISKVRFDHPTVLWRGFGRPDLPRDKDYTGQTISDLGYQSTAPAKAVAGWYAIKTSAIGALKKGGAVFLARIVMPAGSCAAQVGNSDTDPKQQRSEELILPRNTTFKVLKQQTLDPESFTKKKVVLDRIQKVGGIKLIDVVATTPCGKQEPVEPKTS